MCFHTASFLAQHSLELGEPESPRAGNESFFWTCLSSRRERERAAAEEREAVVDAQALAVVTLHHSPFRPGAHTGGFGTCGRDGASPEKSSPQNRAQWENDVQEIAENNDV